MISVSAFRQDYAEFSDNSRFPNPLIGYWLQIAGLLLNTDKFGMPAPFIETVAALAAAGTGYAANDVIVLAGGAFTTPVSIKVSTVDGAGAILSFTVSNVGAYTTPPSNPVGQQSTTGNGAGATFNLTFASAPYNTYDLATELFIAHNITLERRALDEAAVGAPPGMSTGPVSAKAAANLSLSYDTAIASIEGMGDLNLTIYGTRLAKLIKLFGMGPVSIVGNACGFGFGGWLNGPGWSGPIFAQGINWDD